ncbi:MAG: AMP-binding protein [Myxococcales bacterium]|nr:AMP-binding protein [Myxococcales bacterium]
MLVPDLLREQARAAPDRVAVEVDGVGRMTHAEWEARSNRLARALVDAGLAPGDRVGLRFGNEDGLRFLVAYFAIHKAGGVAVPVSARATEPEMAAVLAHCDARLLLAGRGAPSPRVETLGPDDADARASRQSDATFQVPRSGDDLADILYTSGTTGTPKGVACAHGNVVFKGSSTMDALFRGATFLHAIPLHTFAGTHAMTLIPLRAGMTSLVQPKFDARRFLELIAERGVNLTYAVPAMLLLMLDEPRAAQGGFDSLRLLMYGAAPMPPHAVRRLGEVFPSAMRLNLYGLTEGGAAVCSLSPDQAVRRPDSIGKPVPPAEARIVDEGGEPVAAGVEGEIELRAPVRPRRYYRDDAATREVWRPGGWLRTGDIGRLDDEGYLYLVDRKKDLVIRGGLNIAAPEVEGVLLQHPAVREAAIVGVAHPVLGEDTKAFVVLRQGAAITPEALEAHCRKFLADYKVPRHYAFRDALPRNAMGKVLKRELRAETGS